MCVCVLTTNAQVGSYLATEIWDRNVFRPTQYAEGGACPPLTDLMLFLKNATLDTKAYYVEAVPPLPPLGFQWPNISRSPAPTVSIEEAAIAHADATLDPAAGAAVAFTRRLMVGIGLTAHYVMDVAVAVTHEGELFQSCNLRGVQTCDRWNMRLQDGVLLAIGYAGGTMFVLSAIRLSLLSNLIVGVSLWSVSTTAVMYVCYGYSPTCVPLVPTCFVRDVYTTIESIFPRSLKVPYTLMNPETVTTPNLRTVCESFLTTDCLTECTDTPFMYRDWRDVLAWAVAELDSDTVEQELRSFTDTVPLGLADGVSASIEMKRNVYRLGDAPTISANRICAVLRSYTAVPAMLIAVMAILLVLQLSNLAFTLVYSVLAVMASVLVSVFTD